LRCPVTALPPGNDSLRKPLPLTKPDERLRIQILGAVQGVGFRPFIYRLATEMGLRGFVVNSSQGVTIEAEGCREDLERFLVRIGPESPPRASIQSLEPAFLDSVGHGKFTIRESIEAGKKSAFVLPDIATCADCLREVFDPRDRRHLYPFTNCTHCGPRFSIIEGLPYDRPKTTMKRFEMCAACRREYEDPSNRRFHAQPNACPACGPHVELWDPRGKIEASRHDAIQAAAALLQGGAALAVKGLGGFHLMADARSPDAIHALRARKGREEKPFALMFPSLASVRRHCEVSALEERLLRSPEAPIVLVKARKEDLGGLDDGSRIHPSVAPGNPSLGAMLPCTPLHHILMAELGFPVVATSGNLSDEPICTDERDALRRLGGIADAFLVHDRPIARHVDDSIARVVAGRELVLRRARGYAPLPILLDHPLPPLLAVGAHLKSSVAISVEDKVFVSQHIGDLETAEALRAFREVTGSLESLYEVRPVGVACDLHPDYISTAEARRIAGESALPLAAVQHHHAHVVSCMAENELHGTVLGVSWDGTGYGTDGTIWGGEFLEATRSSFKRVAHLRTFPLPGGEKAVREPRRSALGLLHAALGNELFDRAGLATLEAFSPSELAVLRVMLDRRLNCPLTSSAGRLFDAVASITGLRQVARFEGQAAMELEFALDGAASGERYEVEIEGDGGSTPLVVDWTLMVRQLLEDVRRGSAVKDISARFHNSLVDSIVQVASRLGAARVVLTGGCFQNKYLTEEAVRRLSDEGFQPYWHQRVPPNDGGISLGQAVAACGGLEVREIR
jgi:hydrogenase maturation protein HypF